jgi:hypothetical protein
VNRSINGWRCDCSVRCRAGPPPRVAGSAQQPANKMESSCVLFVYLLHADNNIEINTDQLKICCVLSVMVPAHPLFARVLPYTTVSENKLFILMFSFYRHLKSPHAHFIVTSLSLHLLHFSLFYFCLHFIFSYHGA